MIDTEDLVWAATYGAAFIDQKREAEKSAEEAALSAGETADLAVKLIPQSAHTKARISAILKQLKDM